VRQKLGQHFLRHAGYLARIAAAAAEFSPEAVIEIGAGTGALTQHLLRRVPRVIAIELDSALVELLRRRFASESRLTVVHADVLETDLAAWCPAVIAGNLPYYIASAVIEKVLRLRTAMRAAVFLVQKEVAARLAAAPGSRDYGWLSVETQLFASAEVLFSVPPGAFSPPPKVESAVVRLIPHERLLPDSDEFLAFARACFRHKRKTLRNNLLAIYGAAVEAVPEAARRAEQLSLDQLLSIYERLRR
jgi:16S rRNA (adenine1518-N6/adenine1519-N6)-dimethyltransferase